MQRCPLYSTMRAMQLSAQIAGVSNMKLTYTIWQGSLNKGVLTAKSMKEIIALVDELNEGNPSLKFEYMIHKIEQESK